jgi:deoxycytidine triphosphate deaminase
MDLGRDILLEQFRGRSWSVNRDGKRVDDQEVERLLGTNSLNVTLGRELLIPHGGQVVSATDPESVSYRAHVMATSYALAPHQFILGVTQEAVDCSAGILGPDKIRTFYPSYEGRTTLAKLGLMSQLNPGGGSYGYRNTWTLQLFNCSPNIITLYPGMMIGQLVFREVAGAPRYEGPYNEPQSGPKRAALGPGRV